ncbi:MAG: nitroreductase/quinone reductase family protein [Candidatus Heimdallarchaeota archaeon]
MSQVSPQREKPNRLWRMILWLGPRIIFPLHVRLYRLLGGRLVGDTSVLLTTVGRRSGQPRTVIVGYLRDGEDVIVTSSNFMKPTVPSWVLNLRAHPEAEVRLKGEERYQAQAEFLKGEDRAGQWDRLVAADPMYDKAQRVAGRELSVIRLRRIKGSSEEPSHSEE